MELLSLNKNYLYVVELSPANHSQYYYKKRSLYSPIKYKGIGG